MTIFLFLFRTYQRVIPLISVQIKLYKFHEAPENLTNTTPGSSEIIFPRTHNPTAPNKFIIDINRAL